MAVSSSSGEAATEGHEPRATVEHPRRRTGIDRGQPVPPPSAQVGEAATALLMAQPRYEQLHEAIGRADLKASVAATVEAAGIAVVLGTLAQQQAGPPNRGLLLVGLVALLAGLGFAGAAVFPRLGVRSKGQLRPHARNLLNIRQLHQQNPKELADQLLAQTDRERLEELARQIVWLAQVVWIKNVWLQRSLLAAAAAVVLLVAAYLV